MTERPGGAPFMDRLPQSVIDRFEAEQPQQKTASSDICDGTGYLPRSMSRAEDGTFEGMCISCQEFHPVEEIIPPSKPEWRREFRLAPHPPLPFLKDLKSKTAGRPDESYNKEN